MLNTDGEKIKKSVANIKIIIIRRRNFLFRKRRNKFNESYSIKVAQKFMVMSYTVYSLVILFDLLQRSD